MLFSASSSGWQGRWSRRLKLLPSAVQLLHYDVALPGPLGRSFKIAFGSDFHIGPLTPRRLVEHAVASIADARPELLLLGGDYVSHHAKQAKDLAQLLGQIPATLGRYAVLGNHDVIADPRRICDYFENNGIQVLVNRSVDLPTPFENISICGLDDPWIGRPDVKAAFEGAKKFRIFLTHSPSGLALLENETFDLAFAGHTHGGQIAFPNGKPLYTPHGPLCDQYLHGRHAIGKSTLFVSRGIGAVMLPMRIYAPSDVIFCSVS